MESIVFLLNAPFHELLDSLRVYFTLSIYQPSTSWQAFVCRNLSTDMDLTIYNQMITVQQSPAFAQYFQSAQPAM
jgi:hypothetical protein